MVFSWSEPPIIESMASRKTTKVAALASRYSFRRRNQISHTDDTAQDEISRGKAPETVSSNESCCIPLVGRGRKRKSVEIKIEPDPEVQEPRPTKQLTELLDVQHQCNEENSPKEAESYLKEEKEADYVADNYGNEWFPPNWEQALSNIRKMRKEVVAPVDTMGCDQCHDTSTTPAIQRYQILVSLMLSSQTKDQVTHAAMGKLREHGLTPENIIKTDTQVLEKLIIPVGFYKRKSVYIKKTSQILLDEYGGDIPDTVEKLCKLPGVGPKMAHICMNCAWNIVSGIGVDVHVHRISQRIGWLPPDVMKNSKKKKTLTPEDTREGLESWLPKSLWSEVNHLLVGFGQTICKPVNPSCNKCLNNSFCPSAKLKW